MGGISLFGTGKFCLRMVSGGDYIHLKSRSFRLSASSRDLVRKLHLKWVKSTRTQNQTLILTQSQTLRIFSGKLYLLFEINSNLPLLPQVCASNTNAGLLQCLVERVVVGVVAGTRWYGPPISTKETAGKGALISCISSRLAELESWRWFWTVMRLLRLCVYEGSLFSITGCRSVPPPGGKPHAFPSLRTSPAM